MKSKKQTNKQKKQCVNDRNHKSRSFSGKISSKASRPILLSQKSLEAQSAKSKVKQYEMTLLHCDVAAKATLTFLCLSLTPHPHPPTHTHTLFSSES